MGLAIRVGSDDSREKLICETRTLCSEFFTESGASALSVSIRYQQAPLLCEAWGEADRRFATLAATDTAFLAGSITKQFVAAAALIACDEANTSIDVPIAELIDVGKAFDPSATIRHLLSHTSGLRSALEFDVLADSGHLLSLPVVLQRLAAEAPHLAPGNSWFYSNIGYFVVGHAVERLAGCSLPAFLESRLLQPARMNHARLDRDSIPVSRRAVGHRLGTVGFETIQPPRSEASFGSGNLYCSPGELASWGECLWIANRFGSKISREMSTPYKLNDGRESGYGLGTYVTQLGEYLELSHDGHSAGFSAQLATYPNAELVVCTMLNTDQHIAERLEKSLTRNLLGLASPGPIARDIAQSMDEFVGEYLYGPARVPIARYEGGLMIKTPSGRLAELTPVGPGQFVESDDADMKYAFETTLGERSVHISRLAKHLATLVQIPRN